MQSPVIIMSILAVAGVMGVVFLAAHYGIKFIEKRRENATREAQIKEMALREAIGAGQARMLRKLLRAVKG